MFSSEEEAELCSAILNVCIHIEEKHPVACITLEFLH